MDPTQVGLSPLKETRDLISFRAPPSPSQLGQGTSDEDGGGVAMSAVWSDRRRGSHDDKDPTAAGAEATAARAWSCWEGRGGCCGDLLAAAWGLHRQGSHGEASTALESTATMASSSRGKDEDDGDLGRRRCRVRRWRSPATTVSWNGDKDEGGDVRDLRWRRLQWWKTTATASASLKRLIGRRGGGSVL